MISQLLFILICIYLFYVLLFKYIKNGCFIFNFNSVFTLGFVYYIILPYFLCVFTNNAFLPDSFELVYQYSERITEFKKIIFLLSIFLLYISMTNFSKLHSNTNLCRKEYNQHNTILFKILFFVVSSVCMYYSIASFRYIGGGYMLGHSETIGALISFTSILFILSIIIVTPQKSIITVYTLIYLFFALIIVSMGTRMYLITSILALLLLYTYYRKQIRIKHLLLYFVAIAFIFSIIGVIRNGGEVSYESMTYILLGEPIFTSCSLFSFLQRNDVPLLSMPKDFFIYFYELIPKFLDSDKIEILRSAQNVSQLGIAFESPLGAINVFVSLMFNFGIIGIPFFCFLISILLRYIRKLNNDVYFYSTSIFMFIFFRDPFNISIVKMLFEVCYLIPMLLLYIGRKYESHRF